MRVAAVQYRATPGDVHGARTRLRALAAEAAVGADLVVLPELATTTYLFDSPQALAGIAEPPDGPTLAALAPVARAQRCWIVAGIPEDAGDRLYNSALVIGPGGTLEGVYRKTLLFPPDEHWATPGDSGYLAFDSDAGRFGVGICMDLNDERFVDWVRSAGLKALAFPTNWVQEDADVWSYWAWRMLGTGCALVAANTWGRDGELAFTGRSAVVLDRRVLAGCGARGDGVVRASVP